MNKNSKPLMTPDGEFPSISAAARHYGVTSQTILYRLDRDLKGYWLLDEHGQRIQKKTTDRTKNTSSSSGRGRLVMYTKNPNR